MTDFGRTATTTLGNQVYEALFRSDTQDQLADSQRVSGNHLTKLEMDYTQAASLEDNPEKIATWAKDNGFGDVKNQNALLSMIDGKMNRSTQVFMSLQKIRDRMHDMMMELIRSLGKV